MNVDKYLNQLDVLEIYMRLKIHNNINSDFEFFLNNIRYGKGIYTYNKHVNINYWSNNYNSDSFFETYKLYRY